MMALGARRSAHLSVPQVYTDDAERDAHIRGGKKSQTVFVLYLVSVYKIEGMCVCVCIVYT